MQDRQKVGNGKSSKIVITNDSQQGYASMTWEQFRTALLQQGVLCDIAATPYSTGGVTKDGTPLNMNNLLSKNTAEGMGLVWADDPVVATPNDAFKKLSDKLDVINTGTLTTSGWSSTGTNIWTQTIQITGMTSSANVMWDVNISSQSATDVNNILVNSQVIGKVETTNGGVKFTAYGYAPTVNIPVKIRGI